MDKINFPIVTYSNEHKTGLECIRIVCEHNNIPFNKEEILKIGIVDDLECFETYFLNMEKVFESFGAKVITRSTTYENLINHSSKPCISFLSLNHFIVVRNFTENGFMYHDDTNGIKFMPKFQYEKDNPERIVLNVFY